MKQIIYTLLDLSLDTKIEPKGLFSAMTINHNKHVWDYSYPNKTLKCLWLQSWSRWTQDQSGSAWLKNTFVLFFYILKETSFIFIILNFYFLPSFLWVQYRVQLRRVWGLPKSRPNCAERGSQARPSTQSYQPKPSQRPTNQTWANPSFPNCPNHQNLQSCFI